MSSTAIFLILLSAMLHVGWVTVSKHENPTASFFMLANSMGCFLFLPFVFKYWQIYSTVLSHIWIYAVVTGCLLALYFVSLAKMLQAGDLSTSSPLLRASPVILVLLSITTATFLVIPECLCRESRGFRVMQRQRLCIPAKNMPE